MCVCVHVCMYDFCECGGSALNFNVQRKSMCMLIVLPDDTVAVTKP